MPEPPLLTVKNAVAAISINDAPCNRMSLDYMDSLERLLPKLAEDNNVRALVFTGEGKDHFSVGMHLKQFAQGMKRKGGADALLDQRLRVLNTIEHLGKPSIATLFGFCLGGGLELPLACHFRIAAAMGRPSSFCGCRLQSRPPPGYGCRDVHRNRRPPTTGPGSPDAPTAGWPGRNRPSRLPR